MKEPDNYEIDVDEMDEMYNEFLGWLDNTEWTHYSCRVSSLQKMYDAFTAGRERDGDI